MVPILLASKLDFSGESTAVPGQASREAVLQPVSSWELHWHPAGTYIGSTPGYCNAMSHTFSLFTWSSSLQRVFRVETLVHGLIQSSHMGIGGYCSENLTTITGAALRGLYSNSISPGTAQSCTITELDVTVALLTRPIQLKINQEDIPHLRLRRVLVCSWVMQ